MQNLPLVSIICMCYNHQKFVIQSLDSVINQSYPNIELLITDDCSLDESVIVIKNWLVDKPNVKFIENKTNLGNTKTFNKALKLSKGQYVIDLAADDVLFPYCVKMQLDAFQNSVFTNLGIVYGNALLITEKGIPNRYYYEVDSLKKVIKKPASGDIYLAMMNQSSMICSVSSMMKRSVLDDLKGYDENLAYEDLDVWIRTSRNYNFEFIDAILVQKREVTNSLGSQFFIKNNQRTRKINYSSYLVVKKAMVLNKTKQENKALLKRMHFEIMKARITKDWILFLKYIPLELKLRLF